MIYLENINFLVKFYFMTIIVPAIFIRLPPMNQPPINQNSVKTRRHSTMKATAAMISHQCQLET